MRTGKKNFLGRCLDQGMVKNEEEELRMPVMQDASIGQRYWRAGAH